MFKVDNLKFPLKVYLILFELSLILKFLSLNEEAMLIFLILNEEAMLIFLILNEETMRDFLRFKLLLKLRAFASQRMCQTCAFRLGSLNIFCQACILDGKILYCICELFAVGL